MKHKRLLLVLAVLWGAALACRLPGASTTPEVNVTVTPIYQIVTATPEESEAPDIAPSPTVAQNNVLPTDTVPVPTETSTAPPPSPTPIMFSPAGFLTVADDYKSVTIYNLMGQALAVVRTPGMSNGSPSSVHFAGALSGDAYSVPVVFVNMENQGRILQSLNDQITELFPGPDVTYLNGAPGSNIFTFTTNTRANDGSAISRLYVYAPPAGGTPVHEWVDVNSTVIFPMAVKVTGNIAQSIWYSHMLWGIGGDIVFPPQEGLYRFDVATQMETLLLTADYNPVGLSPDQRWVAYVPVGQGYGDGNNQQLTLYDLVTTVMIPIPLTPGSDRGAGYAVFSPDDKYVAWMEGSGWQMAETPNFTSRVRIASTDGSILADLPVGTLASVTGIAHAAWAKPVGWLDGETLIVEIRGDDWNNPILVRVRFDGSGLALLAPGIFAGFVYP